jgi:bifunctional DNase/RNase
MGDLECVEVRYIAEQEHGAAVYLGNSKKTFQIFVGFNEAMAIHRELRREQSPRPLTHDLIGWILLGFDIKVRQVVISQLVENTFCATLILEQRTANVGEQALGQRREVRIDARASDSIVIALKAGVPILVAPQVFDTVEHITLQFGSKHQDFKDSPSDHDPEDI